MCALCESGSAVNLLPLRTLSYLGIPTSKLSHTRVTIREWCFPKGHRQRLLGDMKTKMTCYVVDSDASYSLLLGRPWIHDNFVVPSTLHQCVKYVDEKQEVHRVFADKKAFNLSKGLEAYCADANLYKDAANEDDEEEPCVESTTTSSHPLCESGLVHESAPELTCLGQLDSPTKKRSPPVTQRRSRTTLHLPGSSNDCTSAQKPKELLFVSNNSGLSRSSSSIIKKRQSICLFIN